MTDPIDPALPPLARLLAIMARLRDPVAGCNWDLAQRWETIAPYTIEEAYEVADAIEHGDPDAVRDELGDLLFQVVFQSRIAEEAGLFGFGDVATAVAEKMERRHPHIFAATTERPDWEAIKAAERAERAESGGMAGTLAGVALGLPALQRAEKLQKRAARVGFDWPDATGPRAKIDEELAEVAEANDEERADEIGDLLFSIVNWSRHLGIDAEAALRRANAKFERRFAEMERQAGADFAELDLTNKEMQWQEAKRTVG